MTRTELKSGRPANVGIAIEMRTFANAVVVALLIVLAVPLPLRANDVVIELGDTQVNRQGLEKRFAVALQLLARQQGVSLAGQDAAVIEQLRLQYLDKRATELVMLREAARREIKVDNADIDATVLDMFSSTDDQIEFLESTTLDLPDAEKVLRKIIRDEETVRRLTEHMLKEIVVPPGDVITLHHDIKDSLATPEQACVRHIQLASVNDAVAVLSELQNGAIFADTAATHSLDTASASTGGDLGCFERGHSVARSAFEKTAFTAAVGELTGPVESRFGHHIMLVYERKMPRTQTLNEAYVQVERELALEQLPQRLQALMSGSGVKTYPEKFRAETAN